MSSIPYHTALIVGTGPGVSASVARLLVNQGVRVAIAARSPDKLEALATDTGAEPFVADASDPRAVARLFDDVEGKIGVPEIVVYNAGMPLRAPITDLDPEQVRATIEVGAYGAFLVVQQAAKRLVPRRAGAILLTGATASVKGFANSSAFAIAKFGLRGLAQSAARELAPKGIHVAHFVLDGAVRRADRPDPRDKPDSTLDPDAVAESYLSILAQPRNAWTWEVELRPWMETF